MEKSKKQHSRIMKENIECSLTESSKLVNVMNLRNNSHPDDIEVTLLSVCVKVLMASLSVARKPDNVSTAIHSEKTMQNNNN